MKDLHLNPFVIKQQVREYAKKIKIDKIGFASAEPFTDLYNILLKHRELGYESGFEEKDLAKRTNPRLILPNAQSLISIAIAYPTKLNNPPQSKEENYYGFISRSAWGTDYHIVLKEKLNMLAAFLQEIIPDIKVQALVDTGELSDRAVAERAGIGWIGKNSMLITPEFGSWVFLGELITDFPFPPDEMLPNLCGECDRCIKACPTKAIVKDKQINAKVCLAYLTQTKDWLNDEERELIGNRLYGCDTCQIVCPYNLGKNFEHQLDLEADKELAKPLLRSLLELNNKEFTSKWSKSNAAWRGKKPLQRNAIIGLAHFKDKGSVDTLIKLLENDQRPVIRGTAAWSLGKIGSEKAYKYLKSLLPKEKDEKVKKEIEKAIKTIERSNISS